MHAGMKAAMAFCLLSAGLVQAQSSGASRQLVDRMLAHENNAGEHRNLYMYLSEERSERTGHHLWLERVVETQKGRVRLLLAEDGQPLNPERMALEKQRLAGIMAHPEAFEKHEQAAKGDEQHAEQMLLLLQKGFMFDDPKPDGRDLKIAYRPDPAYQPQSMEEKVLHTMVGVILVDEKTQELHRMEGRVPADVNLGFGLLGTIHAGSSFSSAHELAPGNEWKASVIDTAINGKAMLFKAIGKNEHTMYRDFHLVPQNITLAQAVQMVEQGSV